MNFPLKFQVDAFKFKFIHFYLFKNLERVYVWVYFKINKNIKQQLMLVYAKDDDINSAAIS